MFTYRQAKEIKMENEKPKIIPQWQPTQKQRDHLEAMANEEGGTITGYIKKLVNADMRKRR